MLLPFAPLQSLQHSRHSDKFKRHQLKSSLCSEPPCVSLSHSEGNPEVVQRPPRHNIMQPLLPFCPLFAISQTCPQAPASGHLHLLLPLSGMLFPQRSMVCLLTIKFLFRATFLVAPFLTLFKIPNLSLYRCFALFLGSSPQHLLFTF